MGELRERRRRRAARSPPALGGMLVPVADLRRRQRRQPRSARVRGRDVDRHRVRARRARARRAALPGPAAGVPAHRRVVDDIVALIVIATVYTTDLGSVTSWWRASLLRRRSRSSRVLGFRTGRRSTQRLGLLAWLATTKLRRRPGRRRPRHGTDDLRLARGSRSTSSARATSSGSFASSPPPSWHGRRSIGLQAAISPNERLQQLFHPWTSYVIVPLFALANAGIPIDASFLSQRLHLAGDARDHPRLRAREADRHHRRDAARDEAQPWPAPPSRRLGGGRRRRPHRRHRLHGLAADREPRLPRRARSTRRSSAS